MVSLAIVASAASCWEVINSMIERRWRRSTIKAGRRGHEPCAAAALTILIILVTVSVMVASAELRLEHRSVMDWPLPDAADCAARHSLDQDASAGFCRLARYVAVGRSGMSARPVPAMHRSDFAPQFPKPTIS